MEFSYSYLPYIVPLCIVYIVILFVFMRKMSAGSGAVTSDGRQTSRILNYSKFWKKDMRKEDQEDTEARKDNYTEVVNGYYDGATVFYEFGWSRSFHFSRFYKGEGFSAALARHEHYLAFRMGLKPGMRVLDVGCGVGRPACEIAAFANVNVVGVNNNDHQLNNARQYTKQFNLQNQVSFVKGDFMKLVELFGENSFDAVYAIEATCHAPTFEGIYDQIRRVLKPGGIFGVYEWVMTKEWDPSIPAHMELAHEIEIGNGIAEMRPLAQSRQALKNVGFDILYEKDMAEDDDPIKWYYPLEGDIRKAQTFWDLVHVFRISPFGRFFTHRSVWLLELIGYLPKGTTHIGEELKRSLASLVKGGQSKLFTPMYLVINKKPLKASA